MIHFLHKKEKGSVDIHRRLAKVYEADAVDASTWGGGGEGLPTKSQDKAHVMSVIKARSGRPHTQRHLPREQGATG